MYTMRKIIVKCKLSKKGNLYLSAENKKGKKFLVNLIKDGKRFNPTIINGESYEVTYDSSKVDSKDNVIALFGVTEFIPQVNTDDLGF